MLRKTVIGLSIALPLMGALAACDDKGPAEQAGEKIDEAGESISDAMSSDGPAEEMGEKIDEAVTPDQ